MGRCIHRHLSESNNKPMIYASGTARCFFYMRFFYLLTYCGFYVDNLLIMWINQDISTFCAEPTHLFKTVSYNTNKIYIFEF